MLRVGDFLNFLDNIGLHTTTPIDINPVKRTIPVVLVNETIKIPGILCNYVHACDDFVASEYYVRSSNY